MVVHGHTPVMAPQFLPNRINIDTGAYATRRLTCLALEANTLRLIGAPKARAALASGEAACTSGIAI
jgi:serine/threonine protein phosphatase 1